MRAVSRLLCVAGLFIAVMVSAISVQAMDRQGLYQKAQETSAALAKVEPGRVSVDEYRHMAVQVAGLLKALSFQEAAARAQDKAAPPSSAALRPGQKEPKGLLMQSPGVAVPLSQVPDEWFYGYLDRVKVNMAHMMGMLDTKTSMPEDLKLLAETIRDQIGLMSRPPRSAENG
ncbi:hypothetical protein [Aestuariispira ectoiniformans]|uniref:hypothetical protein n=1 Tax=Aestuariispira ectoiniformans TaxID=2775080 RepID=UPI00223BE9C5|nr:hypothetical protein [Aestuariispira ectoiniformans]